MYKVTFGGKKGTAVHLVESPDLVAIRTRGNKKIENVQLSRSGQAVLEKTREVTAFPEAGVSVRRVSPTEGLESAGTRERDAARSALKQEENIRFAGRVLQDADSGQVMLYTENFFVKFLDATPEKDCVTILEKYHLTVKSKLAFATNAYFVQAAEGTGLEVFNIAEKLLAEKKVEYCHPELVQERRFKVANPLQWHLVKTDIDGKTVNQHVNIEAAWAKTRGKGITIAVIDDGVDVEHPEFAGRVVHPFDATENNADPHPKDADENHGTACAGVACAAGLPGGASGTAPEATLMPIRLRSGLGSMAEANAFVWAADHGADVVSCSWGPTDGEWWNPNDPIHTRPVALPDSTRLAMDYVLNKGRGGKGTTILFAAGNGNEDTRFDGYANYPGIIAVAACNDTGKRSVYSDFGDAVWACFPSADFAWKAFKHPAPITEGLRTTDRRGGDGYTPEDYYNGFGGTSAACPGMAGVVALMLAVNPNLGPAQVRELLRQSCTPIDTEGGDYQSNGHSIYYGYGRIDAGRAVENALKAAQEGPGIQGSVRFDDGRELALQPGVLAGADFKPARRALGFRLRLNQGSAALRLRYRVNIATKGIAQNQKDGEYVGATGGTKRILGFSVALEGAGAAQFEVEYAARLKGRKTLSRAKNGQWCGTDKKTGKTVEALSVLLRKK